MRKRDLALIATISVVGVLLLVSGCAQLDKFFTPDPVTGVAPATEVGESIRTVAPGIGLGGWGEIAVGILGLVGAGYLLVRKIQKKVSGKGTAAK